MTELKTLKDLEKEIKIRCKWAKVDTKNIPFVLYFVKTEAIKWIKEDLKEYQIKCSSEIIVNWIKRFNITEEELQ